MFTNALVDVFLNLKFYIKIIKHFIVLGKIRKRFWGNTVTYFLNVMRRGLIKRKACRVKQSIDNSFKN